MRIFVAFILCAALGLSANAQTNAVAPKLGIICGLDEAGAGDLLTAELTKTGGVELLERTEMEKVLTEQGVSAANGDDVKVGRILGADGLLHLEVVRGAEATNLMVRLMAVKPGVVLADWDFPWPMTNMDLWAEPTVEHLQTYLPKLTVLAKDAIPISVVNLRSATASAGAEQTERVLQSLVIERLSQERQLFVLERQKMEKLEEEKNFSTDETAFWNGAYLLEGVSDQSGYTKDTITINARLTSAKGGTPVLLEASGSRTNFSEVVNMLAAKIMAALQVSPTAKEWSAADEAEQYFKEAQWALGWGVYKEAEAAADSAWALGKNDEECAVARIRAYMMEAQAETAPVQSGEGGISPGYDYNNRPLGPVPTDKQVDDELKWLFAENPRIADYRVSVVNGSKEIDYIFVDRLPSLKCIDAAATALRLYEGFSRNSTNSQSQVLSSSPGAEDWHNSDWYQLGLDDLTIGSKVLQLFYLFPTAQTGSKERLAELRLRARTVAELIAQSPSVRERYYTGNRIVMGEELSETIGYQPNIFACMLEWGCFWQDDPEGGVALYRGLMENPAFCYLHGRFWGRSLGEPYLTGWNEEDRNRIPQVWQGFVRDLSTSTNALWRLEAHALELSKLPEGPSLGLTVTNFYDEVLSNHDALVACPVEIANTWDAGGLLKAGRDGGAYSPFREELIRACGITFGPRLSEMDKEYQEKTVRAGRAAEAMAKQERYLRENKPYSFIEFVKVFEVKSYSQQQAREILPLIIAYRSNMLAKAEQAPPPWNGELRANADVVNFFLQKDVEKILEPPAPKPLPAAASAKPVPPVVASQAAPPPPVPADVAANTAKADVMTNVIEVNRFLEIPLMETLGELQTPPVILAHQWLEGKLVLDVMCVVTSNFFDAKGDWQKSENQYRPVIAILDPKNLRWTVMICPALEDFTQQNLHYHQTTLWRGDVYTCKDGSIRKCRIGESDWKILGIPNIGNCELYVVHDHLYATTRDQIVEITDDGNGTRILASNRRRPPVSALDSVDMGQPLLFAGPGDMLRTMVADAIYSWVGTNWSLNCTVPRFDSPPEISEKGILFRNNQFYGAAGIWNLRGAESELEFYFGPRLVHGVDSYRHEPGLAWEMPKGVSFAFRPITADGANFFLLLDHSSQHQTVNEQQHLVTGITIDPRDGYHAALLGFTPSLPGPAKIYLKFKEQEGVEPVTGSEGSDKFHVPNVSRAWMYFGGGNLFMGKETPDPVPGGAGSAYFPKIGVWSVPAGKIDAELERQSQLQKTALAEADAAAKSILEKYDLNHDGKIDGAEKEAAFGDEKYIAAVLDEIDTNRNGLLNADELKWFDANNNNRLDASELTGIMTAERLLAARLIATYGDSSSDTLDFMAYRDMVSSIMEPQSQNFAMNEFFNMTHAGAANADELQVFLTLLTMRSVQSQRVLGRNMLPMIELRYWGLPPEQLRDEFATAVNGLWRQTYGRRTNAPGVFIQRTAEGATSNQ